jgi:hypothetical protein
LFRQREGDTPVIDTTREALLHTDSEPSQIATAGTPNAVAAPSRSMFQTACIAIRLLQDVTWSMSRTGRVAYVDGTTW